MQLGILLEQCLSPVPGGTGRYSRELAAALTRRAETADSVSGWVACHRDVGLAAIPGVAGPKRLPLGRRGLAAAWGRGLGPRVPGDVVHAPTPLAPPRGRRPLVVTVHDAVPWTHPETLTPRGVAWHRRAIARAAATADLIVVPTRAVAAALADVVALRNVLVVGEGISPALALPTDADARAQRLALPPSFLLTVATLEPRKGLDLLFDALATETAPRLPLLIVGPKGWGDIDVQNEARRRGLAGSIRVMGWLEDADLAVLFSRATVLVAPSRAEGFGLPVLEAMAAGTPVVTSADPALVEVGGGATTVAGAGVHGLAQALAELIDNPSRAALQAARGRRRASDFSWDRSADELWRAYHALAQLD